MSDTIRQVTIRGRVQGVGYRAWVEHEARLRHLEGWVRNRRDGSVEAVFVGSEDVVTGMVAACRRGPSSARVDAVQDESGSPDLLKLRRAGEPFSVLGTVQTRRHRLNPRPRWIERDDLVRLIAHVLAQPDLAGPINATAPIPVTNTKFTEELGRRLHRPALFRVPAALLRRLGGDFANELLLGGQRVLPNKALSNGFVFRHETLRSAFEAIL